MKFECSPSVWVGFPAGALVLHLARMFQRHVDGQETPRVGLCLKISSSYDVLSSLVGNQKC